MMLLPSSNSREVTTASRRPNTAQHATRSQVSTIGLLVSQALIALVKTPVTAPSKDQSGDVCGIWQHSTTHPFNATAYMNWHVGTIMIAAVKNRTVQQITELPPSATAHLD
jgi:hypothetical protein